MGYGSNGALRKMSGQPPSTFGLVAEMKALTDWFTGSGWNED